MTKNERLKNFTAKLKLFCEHNYLMIGYIATVVLCELTAVAVTSGRFYITEPWIYLTFIAVVCLASLFINSNVKRYVLFVIALSVNFILDMMFIILYDSTGTVFDYAMINLRQDAMVIVESVPISFTYIFVSAIIISVFCTMGYRWRARFAQPRTRITGYCITAGLTAVVLAANVMLVYFGNNSTDTDDLSFKLYQNESGTYSNKGIIGNFYNEMVRGMFFSDIKMGDVEELTDFVYAQTTQTTDYTGIAEGYNVVTILCESFEWFTFLYDAERYPNGYAKPILDGSDDSELQSILSALPQLFPNLYRFYSAQSTVVLNNSHSLEKTDISENKSIIGNYPLYEYINYAYPNNTVPYSLPNVLNNLYGVESNSFHDGYKTFYNRDEHHTNALGFESYTAAEDMAFETDDTGLGERNLDSQMFETCKEQMFPTDRRFNTYITTITQHGQYAYRENLQQYYDKMDEYGVLPLTKKDDNANALRYYCAAGMDLDKAIGIMLDYLEQNGLADNTIITLFGDHNAYYQGISNYVKDIYSYNVENYTELYSVPVMIKVGNLDIGNPVIQKFTCVADIYPTILDLLGIKTFSNLTYGVSAFSDSESILYSRAYDKFLTDKIYFNSLNHIIYQAPDADEDYVLEIEERALTLLDKISHTNRIFAGDYFAGDREQDFFAKLRKINGMPVSA